MSTAAAITPAHRRTATLAAAVLAGVVMLSACSPIAAQAQTQVDGPVATASASASPTATATPSETSSKTDSVTVGAGVLIAVEEHVTFAPGGSETVGEMAIGERARWTALDSRPSPANYLITNSLGDQVEITESAVYAFPKAGLEITSKRPIVIKSPVGRRDTTSGFGGRLGVDSLAIRSAPTPKADVVSRLRVGQKFAQSSITVTGHSTLFGASSWVVVLLPDSTPEKPVYGFILAEAVEQDPNPEQPEEISAEPTDAPAEDGALDVPTAMASATPTASPSATEAPTVEPTMEPAATEEKKDNSGLVIGGLVVALAALIGGMIFSANRRRKASADAATAKPAVAENRETVSDETGVEEPVAEVAAIEAEAQQPTTKITWGD